MTVTKLVLIRVDTSPTQKTFILNIDKTVNRGGLRVYGHIYNDDYTQHFPHSRVFRSVDIRRVELASVAIYYTDYTE